MANSNLSIRPNLMLDRVQGRLSYVRFGGFDFIDGEESFRYLPGDLVALIYPDLKDARVARAKLKPWQLIQREQYLRCALCGRSCGGTCR